MTLELTVIQASAIHDVFAECSPDISDEAVYNHCEILIDFANMAIFGRRHVHEVKTETIVVSTDPYDEENRLQIERLEEALKLLPIENMKQVFRYLRGMGLKTPDGNTALSKCVRFDTSLDVHITQGEESWEVNVELTLI